MKIELNECPELLQEFISKNSSEGKIICITKHDFTPYYDKSIRESAYKVIIQLQNTFSLFSYYEPNIVGIHEDTMNAGDIIDIIKNAEGDYFDSFLEHL